MTTTLAITPAEWASVQDGCLWLVRESVLETIVGDDGQPQCVGPYPPTEFVAAGAPCTACDDRRVRRTIQQVPHVVTVYHHEPCPDCRIELVGPCSACDGRGGYHNCANGTVTLGYGYAVGQPTPILARTSTSACSIIGPHMCVNSSGAVVPIDNGAMPNIADALAHYGDPAGLIGKWALRIVVQP